MSRTTADPLPLRVIEPRAGWAPVDWAELWEFRELLGFLVWRDVKLRYKQTVLGAVWAVLQPAATMLMFTLLFGRWAKMPSDGLPYSVFAFAGLIPWTFFANGLSGAAFSLSGNTHLISKVYFPRLLIALSSLGTGLLDLLVALSVMLAMMVWFGIAPTAHLAALPIFVALTAAMAFGIGSALAAMCALYRDVRYVIPLVVQLWMFASPVIYPLGFVPEGWRWAFYLNPLVGAIDGFRSALLGLPFNWPAIAAAWAVAIAICGAGLSYFRRVERRLADFI
ncbi:MAG: ABC transporter permease [Acidobacteria bacterium]|nr:ABC transporter permease [Acidobacteriota bacterium]